MNRIDELYRHHFSKLSGLLMHYVSCTIEDAEDTVQAAFLTALEKWPTNPPSDELAWLYGVSRNIALKKKRDSKRPGPENEIPEIGTEQQRLFSESEAEDAKLGILFSFTSDHFSPRNQLILTLKFVCGFNVSQIASSLGMQATTVTKTIQRCRNGLLEKTRFISTSIHPSITELATVTRTIYLLFNEGYKASAGKTQLREEFCEEAVYLARLMLARPACQTHDLEALYALMLFHVARFESRFSSANEIIDLEHQDRSTWNQAFIKLGSVYLEKSTGVSATSTYHLQAAIAWLHISAPDFSSTPWQQIVALQMQLYKQQPSPFVLLNFAVSYFYAGNIVKAGEVFAELATHPYISKYYLFLTAYGKFLLHGGFAAEAQLYFIAAAERANASAEKLYIQKLIALAAAG